MRNSKKDQSNTGNLKDQSNTGNLKDQTNTGIKICDFFEMLKTTHSVIKVTEVDNTSSNLISKKTSIRKVIGKADLNEETSDTENIPVSESESKVKNTFNWT